VRKLGPYSICFQSGFSESPAVFDNPSREIMFWWDWIATAGSQTDHRVHTELQLLKLEQDPSGHSPLNAALQTGPIFNQPAKQAKNERKKIVLQIPSGASYIY
jgi:hypothetical protein